MGDSFFAELKRRNVLRVAFVYLIAAWLILQIADLIVPILGVPDWSNKLIFLLLVLGFPIALIMSWAFERTPEGLKKEKDVDRSKSITRETGRMIDFVIIGVLALALAYSVFLRTQVPRFDAAGTAFPIPAEDGTHSIAVLPLVNMSSDTETDYFSDGLAEELINLLAKVDSLRVAARTSSFAYKGQDQNIQIIGKELGVGHLLEGSVRRSGDRVRVTTQLINVADGFHLWSETYDRKLTDIFALQDEIAAAVVKALRIELLDEEISPERVAVNPAAYDLFLRGRGELNENVAGSLERAADFLNRAIELEPDYAAAMALLASTYLDMDEFGSLSITESLRLSGPLIERALELDPNEPAAWAAQGYRQLRLDQNGLAAESLRRALELAPSDIRALGNYAGVLRTQGRFTDNLELIRTLSELDPQNPNHAVTYEYARAYLGENEQIDNALDRLRERYDDDPRFHDGSATYYRASHQYDRMTHDMLRMRILRPADAWAPGNISRALFQLGAVDMGDQWLEQTRQVNPDSRYLSFAIYQKFVMEKQYGELTKLMRDAWMREATEANYLGLGSALMLDGKPAEAYELLKESLEKFAYEPETGDVSLSTDAVLWLIVAARGTGDDVLASDLIGKAGVQISNVVEQRFYVLDDQSSWAAYYVLAGQRIRALYTMQQAADNGFALPTEFETPFFDELKEDPDFQTILQQLRDNQAMMRDKVLALDNLSPKQDSA
jgi:TolB-like protein/Tfp pilus assembly protein PilF